MFLMYRIQDSIGQDSVFYIVHTTYALFDIATMVISHDVVELDLIGSDDVVGGYYGCCEHRLHSSRGGEGWVETVAAPGFDLGNKLFIIYYLLFVFNPREATL